MLRSTATLTLVVATWAGSAGCATRHATWKPDDQPRSQAYLDAFYGGVAEVTTNHGDYASVDWERNTPGDVVSGYEDGQRAAIQLYEMGKARQRNAAEP